MLVLALEFAPNHYKYRMACIGGLYNYIILELVYVYLVVFQCKGV